mmetsp:Transcript_59370/g.133608  ORF Transcript_59370/g.133608 Transcript_59370/m.133608 type:complete len:198 (-) Transcript_59370:54-647(-)
MADVGAQHAAYAAFSGLPSSSSGDAASGAAGPAPGLLAEAEELLRMPLERPAAFSRARAVLTEHDEWLERRKQEDAARQERRDLLRVPDAVAGTAAAAGSTATATAKPATGLRPGEVELTFHLPDKRQITQHFQISASGFDVYSKAYELLRDKGRAFSMAVSGPQVNRALDEGTWSFDLSGIGFKAGNTYEVKVTQS